MSIRDPIKRVQRLRQAQPKRQRGAGLPAQAGERDRIPPGQYRTDTFPVLSYGATPRVNLSAWRLRVFGLVEEPFEIDWAELIALPTTIVQADIHCVTRWSKLDTMWEGVRFSDFLQRIKLKPEAKFVMEHSYGGYTTNIRLDELLADDVLLAYKYNGEPLAPEHGGPMRLLVPKLYFWKSAKWLNGLEFMAENRPGFWERYGYHMHGDPWTEERFG
jgi:DMSO/TMAO reductase YedYZ molybdopterin-dependent catalytic subunit